MCIRDSYNTVLFLGDGNIYGNNNFNNLTLSATKTYTLASGKTQTVNNLFSANTPQCSGWSTIKTSTVAVSYTHLDVYKRQSLLLRF